MELALYFCSCLCRDEDREDDKTKIIPTSSKHTSSEPFPVTGNPVINFDNPVYGVTGGAELASKSSSDTELEMIKEDLTRPIMKEN